VGSCGLDCSNCNSREVYVMKMCADCNSPTQCKAAKKCLGPKKAKMGGKMKAYKSGGRIDGCAMRGRTRGRTV